MSLPTTQIRLNIGAGDTAIVGFTNLDIKTGTDARTLDYPDESVGEVYASHVLEHIHHSYTAETVREWCRVLEPGGRIRICVPDFAKVEEEHRAGRISPETYQAFLYGSHDEATDRHQAQPSFERLKAMLEACGVQEVATFTPAPGTTDCSVRCPYSLNVEGYKRRVSINRQPKVMMLMSTPRLGFMDFTESLREVSRVLGWQLVARGGTEWAKGMELAVDEVITKYRPDYIMALDYDSVFTVDDCRKLLDFMQRRPDIGAVWPVEAHRHLDSILGFAEGFEQNYDFSGEFSEMGSGHFGCTIIRREVFETIERPWFQSVPGEDGDWKKGVDADIAVWVGARSKGWKFGQLNTVQIGHMELCVKWIGEKGVVWQPIQHYQKKGRPNLRFDGAMLQRKVAAKRLADGKVLVRLKSGIGVPCADREGCVKEWVDPEIAALHKLEVVLEPARTPPEGSPELMPRLENPAAEKIVADLEAAVGVPIQRVARVPASIL